MGTLGSLVVCFCPVLIAMSALLGSPPAGDPANCDLPESCPSEDCAWDDDGDGICDDDCLHWVDTLCRSGETGCCYDYCGGHQNADQGDDEGYAIGNPCDSVDSDRDDEGISDECDNWPDYRSPDLLDSDGDGLGESCDPGGSPDVDGDGQPNREDCDPLDAEAGAPREVPILFVTKERLYVVIQRARFSSRTITTVSDPRCSTCTKGTTGECANHGDGRLSDPPSETRWWPASPGALPFLVRARNFGWETPGPCGQDSSVPERINANPRTCP